LLGEVVPKTKTIK